MLEPLTKDEEDVVLESISYERSQLEEDIIKLRTWFRENPALPPSKLKENDAFISYFLVGCKGNVEKAKKKIAFYYSLRGTSDILSDRNNREQLELSKEYMSELTLKKVLPNGSRVSIIYLKPEGLDKFSSKGYYKRFICQAEYLMRTGNGISGREHFYFDLSQFSITIIMKVLRYVKSIIWFFEYAYPIRVGKSVVFNVQPMVDVILNNVVWPLLSQKLKERVTFTKKSYSELTDSTELKAVMPTIFGGNGPDLIVDGNKFLDEILSSDVLELLDDKGESCAKKMLTAEFD